MNKENLLIEPEDNNSSENDEEDKDSNYNYKQRNKKKEDYVIIELPRDIMNSPEVCAMSDRTATTSRKAVGILSSILMTGKIGDQEADLNQFTLSRSSLERKRISNRTVLMEQSMQEFQEKKPKYAALHWDGALVKDILLVNCKKMSLSLSLEPHTT